MNIVVAATGGVAALKTPALLRRLREAGHEVRAAATDDAYQFVTPLSLAVAAGSSVFDWAAWFAPDGARPALRTCALGRTCSSSRPRPPTPSRAPRRAAPTTRFRRSLSAAFPRGVGARHEHRDVAHGAVARNVATLRADGHAFVGPVYGSLAAKDEGAGVGRMAEPEEIVAALPDLFKPQDFSGKRVLVLPGRPANTLTRSGLSVTRAAARWATRWPRRRSPGGPRSRS